MTSPRWTTSRRMLCFCWLLATTGLAGLLVTSAIGQEGSTEGRIAREDVDTCMACHAEEIDGARAVDLAALSASPHKDLKCQDCHSSINAAPHTPQMLKEKASCATCHPDEGEAFAKSAHAKPDQSPGDHPTCVSCHSPGDPHAVVAASTADRRRKVALCSDCHAQTERMGRYGVDPDAVPSYNESFHGKAFLRFGMTNVAICTDCHRYHDVLPSRNPESPVHRNNAARTCAQSGCHPGAQINFAMSGANHLRLKIKESPVLQIEEMFFRWLTLGVITFLLGGIALDLRKRVFGADAPPAGRLVGFLIALSFLFLVASLLMAYLHVGGAPWSALTAIGIMILAFVLYLTRPHPRVERAKMKLFPRFTVAQRWQHFLLAISFTVLMLTGLPLRFAEVEWLQTFYLLFGGITGARIAHRVAAVVMIFTWIWHTLYLLYRWSKAGFSLKSWTMWPTRKDVSDFIAVTKSYLGLSQEEPKYDRFQFREKFDYFAVYWGMPIMVFSGLVLWFPIYFGNRLPEIGLSFAYIAHSDEAILALLVIVIWHFYNTHFNPAFFPMNPVFYTGSLTQEEMERDHPLELERLVKQEQTASTQDAPQSSPPASDQRE